MEIVSYRDAVEEEFPEMCKRFRELQDNEYSTFLAKQYDYGPGNISLGTTLDSDEDIKNSLSGLWFRMNDKIQRLKNIILNNRKVANEPMEDSWLDLANYAKISQLVKEGKWGH